MEQITLISAFIAGMLSFFSPCILPLIPSYISFITGVTFSSEVEAPHAAPLQATIINSLCFIAGFSFVFVVFGAAASTAGQIFMNYRDLIRFLGGILIIVFALFMIGVIKIPFLNFEAKFHLKSRPAGYFGSFVAGVVFSAGWTPCVGPILGSILVLAAHEDSVLRGMILLGSYSLGLGIPFFITSLSVNSFLAYYKKFNKYIKYINLAAGLFLLAVGILLLAGLAISSSAQFY